MALYQPGFPVGYQPYNPYPYPQYQQPQYQQPGQTVQTPGQQPAQPPIQNGGFIPVRSIDEARNWPIAPGNSITFKDESAPYIYTKTMSYNQLETPRFEKFRLVKEEEISAVAPAQPAPPPAFNPADFATKADFQAVSAELETLKNQISEIAAPKRPAPKAKKEGEE